MSVSPVRPSWAATSEALDDAEMLLRGAFSPLRGFLGAADAASVRRDGRLVDGTPWPVPVTLTVDPKLGRAAAAAGSLDLVDEEGTPVVRVVVDEYWSTPDGTALAGEVVALRPLERGTHRALRRDVPTGPGTGGCGPATIGVPLRRALRPGELAALVTAAEALDAHVRLLPMTGRGNPDGTDAATLVSASLRVRDELVRSGVGADLVPVALARHEDVSEDQQRVLAARVAQAYGATWVPGPLGRAEGLPAVLDLPVAAYDESVSVPALPRCAGLVVLFSGLSGSGKSTLANAVRDALLERDERRPVTLLDGDVVRRMLSAELTFSREHRELNVRRIGYVAAEIARHGGTVLCAPIAPYAAGRAEFREMVEQAGGRFVLVHVATPLEVCEARDRKGLYAKARRGEIPHFTGVSDPYEQPSDADLVIDTSQHSPAAAAAAIAEALRRRDARLDVHPYR